MKLERRLFYEQMLSNEMRGDVMKFWIISIASAESFFMRVQYTQNVNVCNPITITSAQKHWPSSQFSTFQIVTSLFTSNSKWNRTRSSGWNPLH